MMNMMNMMNMKEQEREPSRSSSILYIGMSTMKYVLFNVLCARVPACAFLLDVFVALLRLCGHTPSSVG